MRLFPTKRGSHAWLRNMIPRDRIWRIIDAKDQVLGRVAQQAAMLLLGKHKPYGDLDNMNVGDPVIVVNARHFVLLGRKSTNHEYIHHSGYPGGLKRVAIQDVMRRRPTLPLRKAVYNMLPRNKLRKKWMDNLFVYLDDEHPHYAQNPVKIGPAHIRLAIKNGGPPDVEELAHWWVDNLVEWQTDIQDRDDPEALKRIVDASKRFSTPFETQGLKDLLSLDTIGRSSQEEGELEERGDTHLTINNPVIMQYIAQAEQELSEPAVIVPPSHE